MELANRLCASGGHRAAEYFCPCTIPETLLCHDCLREHMSKNLNGAHTYRPINQLKDYRVPGYSPRYRNRTIELSKMRECTARWTRELQAALEEVEKTNAEDKPKLTTRFGPIMRQSLENNSFDYMTLTLQVSPIRSRISIEHTPMYSENRSPQGHHFPPVPQIQNSRRRVKRTRITVQAVESAAIKTLLAQSQRKVLGKVFERHILPRKPSIPYPQRKPSRARPELSEKNLSETPSSINSRFVATPKRSLSRKIRWDS
jgi:hypothetical protein